MTKETLSKIIEEHYKKLRDKTKEAYKKAGFIIAE